MCESEIKNQAKHHGMPKCLKFYISVASEIPKSNRSTSSSSSDAAAAAATAAADVTSTGAAVTGACFKPPLFFAARLSSELKPKKKNRNTNQNEDSKTPFKKFPVSIDKI